MGTGKLPEDAMCEQRPEGAPQGGHYRGSRWQLALWLLLPNMARQCGHLQHSPMCPCVCAHTHPCTLLIPKYCYTQTFTHSHAAWGDMLKDLTPAVRQYPLLSTAQQPPSPQRHGHPSLLRNTGRRCLAQPSSALGSCTIMPQLSEAYIWDTG